MYVITYGRSSYSREDLDRQLQLLRRSLPSGDVVLGAYGDVAPGTSTQRPALQEALALFGHRCCRGPLCDQPRPAIKVTRGFGVSGYCLRERGPVISIMRNLSNTE